uniref:Transforming acidic coiled-coil-containing protein C-terminal domain-containing protein n=1 Tax=Gadus morhua TaxID=8049 RepID=A0A8C5AD55_GADMO
MGSVPVNDENLGVHRGGKRTSSSDDIFAIEQPTGRQSILRQTENLPNKTVPKGGKVCFQTPRRDPVSKRILSPSKSVKMDNLVECMKALDSLRLDSKYEDAPAAAPSAEDAPLHSRGVYSMDFDYLDAIDPFQTGSKIPDDETGEVRSRLKAEVSGLQAQLRREQLKSQALESNYDQKVKEVVELTNLCDELIAKVQTG